jgi:hypothetical protein
MIVLVATLLTGCSPQPASIKFEGEQTVTVHKMDAIAMNKATVLGKDGKKLDPQPTAACEAKPATVAKLDKDKVFPVAAGEATIVSKIGEVKGMYKFVVAPPDKVEIAGYTAGTPVNKGATVTLTAAVKAGDKVVMGETVEWSSSDANMASVDAAGLVTGVNVGKATITAKAGALSATVDIDVADAAIAATP